jgi:hypothetical protein
MSRVRVREDNQKQNAAGNINSVVVIIAERKPSP